MKDATPLTHEHEHERTWLKIKTTYTLRNPKEEEKITHKHYHPPHTYSDTHLKTSGWVLPLLLKELHNHRFSQSYSKDHSTMKLFPNTKHMPQSHHHSRNGQRQSHKIRLISVTCIPSNPVEHLIVSNVMDFFDCHSMLPSATRIQIKT